MHYANKAQVILAGESMSPGSQILALTATKAKKNIATMNAGKTVDRKNPKIQTSFEPYSAPPSKCLLIKKSYFAEK